MFNVNFEIYTIICDKIREELKLKIRGYISVGTEARKDVLNIYICKDGFEFKYDINNFLERVYNGLTAEQITNDIIEKFKHAVLRKYLYF